MMSHSHPFDYSIAASVLRRADLDPAGLIGSAAKCASQKSGDAIARRVCPIGVRDIREKEPRHRCRGCGATS
ncbi:MAG TPA: hypothetical protein VKS24_17765 [Bradyrhizobium sp.]|nr:hypothetical protein [Bradyrhizobium sp.]